MTSAEIARLLETFRKKFTPNAVIDPDTVKLWNEQFRDVHRDVMRPAALDCLANETSFPKPARLRWYIKAHADGLNDRPAPRTRPSPSPAVCEDCDRGWKDSDETETAICRRNGEAHEFTYPPGLYPCPGCQPVQHERWLSTWVPHALSNQPIKATTTFTYNPKAKIQENRDMLASTKNGADL